MRRRHQGQKPWEEKNLAYSKIFHLVRGQKELDQHALVVQPLHLSKTSLTIDWFLRNSISVLGKKDCLSLLGLWVTLECLCQQQSGVGLSS